MIPLSHPRVKQLIDFFLISCVLNYVIWVIIIMPDLVKLDLGTAMEWLGIEIYQTILETAVLFVLSMGLSALFLVVLWKKNFNWRSLGKYAFVLFMLNFLLAFVVSLIYKELYSDSDDLFLIRIVAVDGTVISFISAAFIALFLIEKNNKEQAESERLKFEAEEQKKRAIQARLDLLNLEIDPHYVFNGLSTLSGLISENTEMAEKFLGLFSKTFRYLLDNKDRRVMTVREEYDFATQYAELISYRYDHVAIELDPAIRQVNGLLPTASLELLIENAVKHNCHTEDKPLKISIVYKDGFVEVKNNFLPLDFNIPSTKIGLTNLQERYSYISTKTLDVVKDENYFIVSLPVLFEEDLTEEVE